MIIRAMQLAEWDEVAQLIHDSTNRWYESHGRPPIFTDGPASTRLFCEVYEDLDPGCCLLAVDEASGRIMGSCFHHPRETHLSLGIMNVHPDFFGRGVAGSLLKRVVAEADARRLPLRLVSSAMNLDSFSLYTRHGFVPRAMYQDLILTVPPEGVPAPAEDAGMLRDATLDDVPELRELEFRINHVSREQDYRYFIANRLGCWHASVVCGTDGRVEGFLASISHSGSRMLGPGFARTEAQAAALIARELNHRRGQTLVWLVPVQSAELVQRCYAWGARNCEIHVAQVRGLWQDARGVNMPTFMPETG